MTDEQERIVERVAWLLDTQRVPTLDDERALLTIIREQANRIARMNEIADTFRESTACSILDMTDGAAEIKRLRAALKQYADHTRWMGFGVIADDDQCVWCGRNNGWEIAEAALKEGE